MFMTNSEKAIFDIKRTKKNFLSLPIDLTSEDTVNADTAREKNWNFIFYEFSICKTALGC